jgi:hypothetical protein
MAALRLFLLPPPLLLFLLTLPLGPLAAWPLV